MIVSRDVGVRASPPQRAVGTLAWRAGRGVSNGVQSWVFSIRPVEVKRFSASALLAGLTFLAGPRFSSG